MFFIEDPNKNEEQMKKNNQEMRKYDSNLKYYHIIPNVSFMIINNEEGSYERKQIKRGDEVNEIVERIQNEFENKGYLLSSIFFERFTCE
ncbi:hypothetical protein TRFO_28649 [Tritrichomonas foetus]|uniref:Uncharacterized protein n=1 Tax=Tritrichomonas foetus TaxID=1144522 RepID=A0A1J4JZR8_9EUKA|nr:hypothetical protein TRFO_28649 [Tritrichomonas foetus]|eukprot:OHT03984.1 hypothetical protein TRFO_28649 [Tritrichomonas foetus]